MKAKSQLKRISNIFLTILLFVLISVIAITIFFRVTGNTPNLGGYMIFRVSSGSMEPELKIGDVILTKEITDITSLEEGDVVTYKGLSGDFQGKLITHQIVKAPYKKNGTYYLVTKGISNFEEDPVISEDQLVGIMVCKIPLLGELYNFFLTPWGLLTAILLIILAFSGEFWNIYKLSHEKEDLPEVSDETLQKAIDSYKKDKEIQESNKEIEAEDNKSNIEEDIEKEDKISTSYDEDNKINNNDELIDENNNEIND